MDKRIETYFGINKDEWLMIMFETAYSYLEQAFVYYDTERNPHTDYEIIQALTRAPGGPFWAWWNEVFEQVDAKIITSYEKYPHIWRRYSNERLKNEYRIIHTDINYMPPEALINKCKTQRHEGHKTAKI